MARLSGDRLSKCNIVCRCSVSSNKIATKINKNGVLITSNYT